MQVIDETKLLKQKGKVYFEYNTTAGLSSKMNLYFLLEFLIDTHFNYLNTQYEHIFLQLRITNHFYP